MNAINSLNDIVLENILFNISLSHESMKKMGNASHHFYTNPVNVIPVPGPSPSVSGFSVVSHHPQQNPFVSSQYLPSYYSVPAFQQPAGFPPVLTQTNTSVYYPAPPFYGNQPVTTRPSPSSFLSTPSSSISYTTSQPPQLIVRNQYFQYYPT
jgi:hypothetical protein